MHIDAEKTRQFCLLVQKAISNAKEKPIEVLFQEIINQTKEIVKEIDIERKSEGKVWQKEGQDIGVSSPEYNIYALALVASAWTPFILKAKGLDRCNIEMERFSDEVVESISTVLKYAPKLAMSAKKKTGNAGNISAISVENLQYNSLGREEQRGEK